MENKNKKTATPAQLLKIELKLAEEVNEFTENIINTVREPLLVLDEELRVIKASRSFYDIFKVKPNNTIGRLIYDLGNHQWDIPKLRELLEKILPEKTSFDNYEVEHDFSSIGSRIMLLNARQIKRGLGKEKIILLAFEDVTERKRRERSLSEKSRLTNEYLKILLEHAHAPIITWDASLHIERFNPEFEKLSGYNKSEVQDKKIEILFPENEVAATLGLLKNTLGGENPEVIEINILTKNKEIRTVLWNSANISDEEGKNTIATIAQDITSRKRTEEALINSEIRYRRLFESAKDGILILDAETGMIVDVNPFLIDLLGYSKENFIKKAIWEIGFLKDIYANKDKFFELQKEKYVRYENLSLETTNGRKIHVEFVSNVYVANNKKVIQCNIRDITEHWYMEKQIIESEDKFRTITESSADAIFIANKEGKYLYVNKQAVNLLGYSEEELLSFSISDISPTERIEEYYSIFQKLFKEGSSYSEIELIRKDGSLVPTDLNAVLLPNGLIYGSCRDITDRKRTEEVLRQKTTLLEAQLNSSIDGIIIVDSQGKKILQNQRAVELWKIPQHIADNEDDNLQIQHVMHMTKNPKMFVRKISDLYAHPEASSFDDVELVNGTILERYSAPVIDKYGKNYGRIWIFHDITKRKRDEQELIKAKEKAEATEIQLLSILENSPTGFSMNTISTGKVRYVNKAFSNIYHIPHELCQNVKLFFEYVYNDQMELGNKILNAVKSADPDKMKWHMIPITDKTTKKVHYVSAANIILKDQDLMISSVWDITSQVENEKRLNESLKKATESDRLKSAFLANMSHEIRTPMNGILGFTQLLKTPKLSGEEQQEFIGIIEKSGERMLNIINDIIDISRIESGKIELSVSDVNINVLTKDIFDFFRPEAEMKKLKFLFRNTPPKNEVIVKTDKEKVNAVLTNLIKNALKFTETGFIEIGYEEKDKFIEFFIKDTGSGVPPKQKEIIFERFRQGSESLTRNYEGAGLGLAISKAYVEMLGGIIWIENNEDQGSTFRFTIPFVNGMEEKEQIQFVAENEIQTIRKLKILVVEDDKTSRMLLNIIIKPLASDLLQAVTGREAIEACRNNPDIDLVLMDIRMPEMDGYEATRQIREFNKKIVIISQTAFAMFYDKEKAMVAGCNDYISKPTNRETLIKMIKKHLHSKNV